MIPLWVPAPFQTQFRRGRFSSTATKSLLRYSDAMGHDGSSRELIVKLFRIKPMTSPGVDHLMSEGLFCRLRKG
jgi:hypothetical protein